MRVRALLTTLAAAAALTGCSAAPAPPQPSPVATETPDRTIAAGSEVELGTGATASGPWRLTASSDEHQELCLRLAETTATAAGTRTCGLPLAPPPAFDLVPAQGSSLNYYFGYVPAVVATVKVTFPQAVTPTPPVTQATVETPPNSGLHGRWFVLTAPKGSGVGKLSTLTAAGREIVTDQ